MSTLRLPQHPSSSRVARTSLCADLQAAGVSASTMTDAEIVLGELVANAIEHGRPDHEGMFEVSWHLLAGRLRISVLDTGTAHPLRAGDLEDAGVRGRGLALVDAISDRWSHEDQNGTRVTAELLASSSVAAGRPPPGR